MNNQVPSIPDRKGTARPAGAIVHQHDNTKLGVWIFLGGEVIFFSTLILSFLMFRLRAPDQYELFKQHLSIPLIGLNTFVLISSSFMVVRALEAIREGKHSLMIRNLVAVMVLGGIFVSGQAFEWITLFGDGVGIGTQFGTPFFTITGIHGTHVLLGLLWAGILLFITSRAPFTARRHHAVELFGLYWHFVDIVWIVLFTLFYLI